MGYSKLALMSIFGAFVLVCGVEAICGSPELPFMGTDIGHKEVYEDGDKVTVRCLGGTAIHPHVNQTGSDIVCASSTWTGTSLRCSQVLVVKNMSVSLIGSNASIPLETTLKKEDFRRITDNNPQTCVMLNDEEKWEMSLSKHRVISHVALIVTNLDHRQVHNQSSLAVYLAPGDKCQLENHSQKSNLPLIFLIFRCPTFDGSSNVSIHLKGSVSRAISICEMELFAVRDDDCGKPEIPLYSYVNFFTIQNDTRVAEYICSDGYHLQGNGLRMCGKDGFWYPRRPPSCWPQVTCDTRNKLKLIDGSLALRFAELDLFGNAIPGVSTIRYECLNSSLAMQEPLARDCLSNGSWSWVQQYPECVSKTELVAGNLQYKRNSNFVIYAMVGGVLFLVMTAVMTIYIRRMVSKLHKDLNDSRYKSKVLPQQVIDIIAGNGHILPKSENLKPEKPEKF